MANLEKHVKSPEEEWAEAEASPVPTHARSPRLIGQYVKDQRLAPARQTRGNPRGKRQILLRVEGVRSVEQMERKLFQMNRQLAGQGLPFRLKRIT